MGIIGWNIALEDPGRTGSLDKGSRDIVFDGYSDPGQFSGTVGGFFAGGQECIVLIIRVERDLAAHYITLGALMKPSSSAGALRRISSLGSDGSISSSRRIL